MRRFGALTVAGLAVIALGFPAGSAPSSFAGLGRGVGMWWPVTKDGFSWEIILIAAAGTTADPGAGGAALGETLACVKMFRAPTGPISPDEWRTELGCGRAEVAAADDLSSASVKGSIPTDVYGSASVLTGPARADRVASSGLDLDLSFTATADPGGGPLSGDVLGRLPFCQGNIIVSPRLAGFGCVKLAGRPAAASGFISSEVLGGPTGPIYSLRTGINQAIYWWAFSDV